MADLRTQLRPHIEAIGQVEAARRGNVQQSAIARYLSRERGLSVAAMLRLIDGLELDIVLQPRQPTGSPHPESATDHVYPP